MSRRKLGRTLALTATTVTVLGLALGLASGGPLRASEAHADALDALPGAAAVDHQLASLRLFNRVVLLIRDHYVDQEKIHPREMMLSSLDWVEKRIAEVLVDERDALDSGKVVVTVGNATKTFDISEVDTLWDMSFRLKDVFAFIEKNLVSTQDTREIEYAAINGMLATLDPHSNLLSPEQYADMKMHTRGEFGGLGFVVSVRKGRLTVMKVLPDTPASRGGIKARDVITRIEDESTVNMDVTEAVKRLRGKPGSQVSFWVERDGWESAKQQTLTRAIVAIEALDPVKLLADNVGYVRILNFQGNTTRELRAALEGLERKAGGELKGLVLDLRNNPGGLLDQAVKVSDLFVDDGTIVSTVSAGHEIRERNNASRAGPWEDLPLAVLVNQRSASASEIVSGAIKHLGRGVVIGSQTFGKGSVQVLYDLFDESALKLTIAEYLTAGDLSIQELGVTPDIDLVPALVTKDTISVFAPREVMSERELAQHLESEVLGAAPGAQPARPAEERAPEGPKPEVTFTFLEDAPEEIPEDEDEAFEAYMEEEWKEDFHVRFARELLARAGAPTAEQTLAKGRKVIEERAASEKDRIYEAIRALGVNWNGEDVDTDAPLAVSATLEAKGPVKAGSTVDLVLTVRNDGAAALDRVRAWTVSQSPRHVPFSRLFDDVEFVFGHLEPGESKQWTVPVEIPESVPARVEPLEIQVEARGDRQAEPIPARLAVEELERPHFAFGWYLDDTEHGNGDGRLSPGEEARLVVSVRNTGPGKALEAVASIKNLEDERLYISKGRHEVGELDPGTVGRAPMVLDLKPEWDEGDAEIRLTVYDAKLGEVSSNDVTLPVAASAEATSKAQGSVRLTADSPVRAWAAEGAPVLARASTGAVLPATHKVGAWYRVELGGYAGFVPAAAARHQGTRIANARGEVEEVFLNRPPRIELDGVRSVRTTDADTLTLQGRASDDTALRDLYVFLNDQKVYFKAAEPGASSLQFDARIPLDEGLNTVLVFARENDELVGRETLMVYRQPGAEARTASAEGRAEPVDTAP